MELSALLLFGGVLAVAAGSPGPSLAALCAQVVTRGWRPVLPFAAAMWLGEALWLALAVFGLTTLAESLNWLFVALKYLGVAYLCWLAWKLWRAPVTVEEGDGIPRGGTAPRLFLAGLAVTLGNPKIMLFYLALLPSLIDLAAVDLLAWGELTLVMLAVLVAVDLAWMLAAVQARRLLRSPRALRFANRLSAGIMGAAAAAIAARS